MQKLLLVALPFLVNAAFLRSLPADQQVQLAADKKAGHYGCEQACKPSPVSESACITACETEYYNCMDDACHNKVLAHYKETKGVPKKEEKDEKKGKKGGDEKKGEKKAEKKDAKKDDKKKKAALIGAAPVQLSAEDKKAAHFGCVNACKNSPCESNCITACEAAHYQCMDVTCQDANLKHFAETKGVEKKEEKKEKGGDKKDAKKGDKKKEAKKEEKKKAALIVAPESPLVAQKTASKPVQLSTEAEKTAHFGCVKACTAGPVESKCVTACEAAHYQCADVTCQEASLKHFQETKGVEKKEEKKEDKKGDKGKKAEKKEEKKADAKKEEKKK